MLSAEIFSFQKGPSPDSPGLSGCRLMGEVVADRGLKCLAASPHDAPSVSGSFCSLQHRPLPRGIPSAHLP